MSTDPTWIDIRFDPREQRMDGIAYHGNTPFNVPYISQVTNTLWQGGCTNGLVLPEHIEHVISLYPWEAYTVNHELKSYMTVKMYDSEGQAMDQVDHIARWARQCVDDGPTLIHCQAGLNRSGLVAARTLMLGGKTAGDAIALLRVARSNPNGTSAVLCNKAFVAHLVSIPTTTDEMIEKTIRQQETRVATVAHLRRLGLEVPPDLQDEQDAGLDG